MDDKKTQSPPRSIDDVKLGEFGAQAYESYVVSKIQHLVKILQCDRLLECLDRFVVFESMMFYSKLKVLEYTCRFLLTRGSKEGEMEVGYDLPSKAMKEYRIQIPEKLRFFYVVNRSIHRYKPLTEDQLLEIRKIQAELRFVMAFARNIKDPLKRLLLFIEKK